MNKTNIEWTDFTWNPVTGCLHACPYCYAREVARRWPQHYPDGFEPTFHPERLGEPGRKTAPARIFVCSMADLFGAWVPVDWIEQVFAAVRAAPQHTFQFLTKNPQRYAEFDLPANGWYGTTVDSLSMLKNKDDFLRAIPDDRLRFVSFEPLLERIDPDLAGIGWVIIGGRSRTSGAPKVVPDPAWVQTIIDAARDAGARVFVKKNAGSPPPIVNCTRSWPHEFPDDPHTWWS